MKTDVHYYATPNGTNVIREFILSLEKRQQAKVRHISNDQRIWSPLSSPYKKIDRTPLWEIRILGNDNIRVIYVVPFMNTVLVLHGFIKNRKNTTAELQIAQNRLNDWQQNH